MQQRSVAESPPDWEELYRSHGPRMLRQLTRLIGAQSATDLLHDSFVKAMHSDRPPTEPVSLHYWLYRIATNLAIDHLRKRSRWHGLRMIFSGRDELAEREDRDVIRLALQEIPVEQAAALVLRAGEGFRPSEIAQIMGVSEAATKSRLARGRLNFIAAYRRVTRP